MPPASLRVARQVQIDAGSRSLVGRRRERCTDAACLVPLALVVCAAAALGVFGWRKGHPELLQRFVRGTDSQGRWCGVDAGVEDWKLTYFTLPPNFLPTLDTVGGERPPLPMNGTAVPRSLLPVDLRSHMKAVCTSKCPQSPQSLSAPNGSTEVFQRERDLCPPTSNCTWYRGGDATQVLGYCVDLSIFEIRTGQWEQWFQDLEASAPVLLAATPISLVCGIAFLTFVRFCGPLCVWAGIAVIVLAPSVFGLWLYLTPVDAAGGGSGSGGDDSWASVTPKTRTYIIVVLACLSGAGILMACCVARSIRKAAAILRVTAKFLEDLPMQMFVPLGFGVCHLLVILTWVAAVVPVASIGLYQEKPEVCLRAGDVICLEWKGETQWLGIIFMVVVLYTLTNLLHALSHYTTAYSVGAWYFAPLDPLTGRKQAAPEGRCLSIRGVCNALCFHLGSLAYGAFAVAITQVARLLLFWVTRHEEQTGHNPLCLCCLRCVNCLAACFEKFLNFVSEHAYVEIALQGEGFCASAGSALAFAARRPALFLLVGRVAVAVRLLGMATVMLGTTAAAWFILLYLPPSGLGSVDAPLVAVAFTGLVVGEVMMHPFTVAARSMLHCFCLDDDNSYTPQPLQLLVEEHGEGGEADHRG